MNILRFFKHLFPFRTLNKYILTGYLFHFVTILLAGLVLGLVVHFFEHLDAFSRFSAHWKVVGEYILLSFPQKIMETFILFVGISVGLFLGNMQSKGEWIAISAAGGRVWQVGRYLIVFLACLAIAEALFNELVAVRLADYADKIWQIKIQKKDWQSLSRGGIWLKPSRDWVMYARYYHPEAGSLLDVRLYQLSENDNEINTVLFVRKLSPAEGGWKGEEVERWQWLDNDVKYEKISELRIPLNLSPEAVESLSFKSRSLTLLQLGRLIEQAKQTGVKPAKYIMEWHLKLALPVGSFIVGLFLWVTLGGGESRLGKVWGLHTLVVGLATSAAYMVILFVFTSLGRKGWLPVAWAPWLVNAPFIGYITWKGLKV